jgi:hypothetical protein
LIWRDLPLDDLSEWVVVDNFVLLLLGFDVGFGVVDDDIDELDPVWLPSVLLEVRSRLAGEVAL